MYNNNNGHGVKKEETTSTTSTSSIGGTVYPIYLSNTAKKWNVAKFTSKVDFNQFVKPVKMFKYKGEDVQQLHNEENGIKQEKENQQAAIKAETSTTSTGGAPAIVAPARTKKRAEPKPVNPKTIPWRIEDSEGNHPFQGMIEGNQSSSYFLFMFQSNGSIRAVPCTDWYTFRMRKDVDVWTTEEAEEIMSKNMRDREVWSNRLSRRTADEKRAGEQEDTEDTEFRSEMHEDKDKFKEFHNGAQNIREEEKRRQQQAQQRRRRNNEGEEGGGEDEDAPDFESRFDDDDEAFEDNDFTTEDGPQIEEEEDSNENLTAAGVEMKNILKSYKVKQEDSDIEDSPEDDDDDELDEDPDDDDFTLTKAQLQLRYPRNISDTNGNANGSPTSANGSPAIHSPNTSTPPSPTQSTGSSGSSSNGKSTTPKSSKKAPAKSKVASPPDSNAAKGKRKETVTSPTAGSTKKAKPEQSSPSNSPPNSPPPASGSADEGLSEDAMKRVLLERKKIKTLEFIQIFKHHLRTPEAKKQFSVLLNRLAHVVTEGDVKYLVPNDKYY